MAPCFLEVAHQLVFFFFVRVLYVSSCVYSALKLICADVVSVQSILIYLIRVKVYQ